MAWRNVPSQPQRTEFDELSVAWWPTRNGGYRMADADDVVARFEGRVVLEVDGVTSQPDVLVDPATGECIVGMPTPGGLRHVRLRAVPRFTDPAQAVTAGSLLAPMPGTVLTVAVQPGQEVTTGQKVLVMEAMKMQHTVTAPVDGTVTEIHVNDGEQVAAGAVLAVVTEAEPDPEGES